MAGPLSTTDFSEIKKGNPPEAEACLFAVKKASLRHASSGPLSYSQSLEKTERDIEMSLCQNRFQYTRELKGVGGEKRIEETQRRERRL